MPQGVFDQYQGISYPWKFRGRLHIPQLVGGIPFNPNIAKGWIETALKGKENSEERIREMIAETMVELGVSKDEAVEEVNRRKNLNGFKRERCRNCPDTGAFCVEGEHPLYWEGRCLKAAIKEAVSVAVSAGKLEMTGWGTTRKWLTKFMPEHVFVPEHRLYPVECTCDVEEGWGQKDSRILAPTDILQQFVHVLGKSAVQYQEYLENVDIEFTVKTDFDFTQEQWAMIWTTGENNGVGASRSQGYGTYTVTRWEPIVDQEGVTKLTTRKAAAKVTSAPAKRTGRKTVTAADIVAA
jgi:hypothetical protein